MSCVYMWICVRTLSACLCVRVHGCVHFTFDFFYLQTISLVSYNPSSITPEEYFNAHVDLGDRDIGRPIEQSTKVQKFRATLWLCEDFPLSLQEQVLPIIDLMATSNAHFAKLRDFITLQLPSGFPVKIGQWPLVFAYEPTCLLVYMRVSMWLEINFD